MSAETENTTVTHPDGTTIETVTSAGTTTTTVIHADGTTLSVSTLGNEDAAAEQQPKQRVLLPTTATPSHYSVHLTPDMEAFTFSGEETVSLIINEGGISEIQLHALDITIASASFHTASGANIASTGITYQKEKLQTATIAFSESLPAGPGELKLAFQGELNDKMCGFYRSTYEVDGVKKVMATTQFEATDARRAFPCWDEPAQKATFAFTLTVPKHMTAVSNMPVRSEVAAGPDTQTVAFETSVKMSSYLGAFVVGEMAYIESKSAHGIPCRVYATAGKEAQGAFALDVCGKVLDFFDDYFGIPYPLPKMDMLAIPDFAAGAMENYGCVTYRETAILWDSAKSASSAKQRVAYVVAHELAHQWFGNLTTMQWWDNLWLNEGFATFVGTMAVDKLFPEWDIWTQFVKDDWANALDLDSMRSSHPIQVEVYSADEVSEIFDAISYYKGASVIRSVFEWIGESAFQEGLQKYLAKFQFANTVTDDLWGAWEDSSGKPVRTVMSTWTLQTGYPLLTVSEQCDNAGLLSVEQTRFLKDGSAGEGLWKIPVATRMLLPGGGADGDTSTQYTLLETATGTLPMPTSGVLKVNPGQAGVYRVRYSPELLAKISPMVSSLPASDRIGLVGDAFALATAGLSPVVSALSFLEGFKGETEYSVWSNISGGLGPIKSILASDSPAYGRLKSFIRSLYGAVVADVGWNKAEGEAHTTSLKRSLVLKAMGGADDADTIKLAMEKFQGLISGSGSVDADLKLLVYSLAVAHGGEDAYTALLSMYRDPSTMSEEKVRILQSLGSTRDEGLMAKTLGMLLDPTSGVRPQDSMYCLAGVAMNLVYGRAFAWQWMKDNWDALFEKFGTGGSFTLPRLVSYATKGLVTEADADDVEAFFRSHKVEGATRTVQQSVESIRTAAAMSAREGEALRAWLQEAWS